jgi:cytochrome c5
MNRSPFRKIFFLPVFSVFILTILPACHHESLLIEGLDTVCFYGQVMPVLEISCGIAGCHDGSQEGFLAADYSSVMQSIVPGDPRGSKLYQVITDINGETMMPPDIPLSKEVRSTIQVWIAQGAIETSCDTGNGGSNPPPPATNDSICFVQDILPLFLSNCAMSSCHDGLSQGEEDNLYALNSYTTIRAHVVPFEPSRSPVYSAVTGSGEEFMPPAPKSPLTNAQKELMRKWIADGALNSDCPDATCDTVNPIQFAAQVKPIIDSYCVSCHNASSSSGGVNLNGYDQVKKYAEMLRNGTPLLVGTIRHKSGFKAMPPSTTLDECSIRKIELWINQGKLNN